MLTGAGRVGKTASGLDELSRMPWDRDTSGGEAPPPALITYMRMATGREE